MARSLDNKCCLTLIPSGSSVSIESSALDAVMRAYECDISTILTGRAGDMKQKTHLLKPSHPLNDRFEITHTPSRPEDLIRHFLKPQRQRSIVCSNRVDEQISYFLGRHPRQLRTNLTRWIVRTASPRSMLLSCVLQVR